MKPCSRLQNSILFFVISVLGEALSGFGNNHSGSGAPPGHGAMRDGGEALPGFGDILPGAVGILELC